MIWRASILILIAFGAVQNAAAIDFTITPVTTNSYSDLDPQVSGPYVVWYAQDGASADREIMRYYHFTDTVTPLTNNTYLDSDPQLSGYYTTWWGEPDGTAADGVNREIFFHDNSTATRLTTDSVWDREPQISGSNVVWGKGAKASTTRQIYKFDGTTTAPLTTSGFNNTPQISGNNVVFGNGSVPNREIIMHDGSTFTQLTPVTNDEKAKNVPQISGNKAVWEGFLGNTTNEKEIIFHDGTSATAISNASPNDTFPDHAPQISGDKIVWWGGTFKNNQIYFYDGAAAVPTVTPLTSSELNQWPQISGNNVVWQGKETLADDFEIFFWDGNTVKQLTDNDYDDMNPQISGFNVVWEAYDDGDSEIYFAQANLLTGDATLDGEVDIADFTLWADGFDSFHGNATFTDGDFNGDGETDIADFTLWADHFGETAGVAGGSAVASVPEPSSLVLIIVGAVGLLVWRLRRS